jgi:adenosylcobinamide-phosphate guanylyltransferase
LMAVVMAGGRATRFGGEVEKALLEVGGVPLLVRAFNAVGMDGLNEVAVAVSPHTPRTREEARRRGMSTIDTQGLGYHQDVTCILEECDSFLTVNVDVPFVTRNHVGRLLESYEGGSIAVIVDAATTNTVVDGRSLGTMQDGRRFIWVGLNIVTPNPETKTILFDDPMLAVNINDEDDLATANAIALEKGI